MTLISNQKPQQSYVVPLQKVILLSIFSYGWYPMYWIYRNWKGLQSTDETKSIRPLLWTFGSIIPIWQCFLIARQFEYIKTFLEFNHQKPSPQLPIAAHLFWLMPTIASVMGSMLKRLHIPYPFETTLIFDLVSLITIVSVIAFVQKQWNMAWRVYEQDKAVSKNHYPNMPEIIFLIIGLFSWGLLLIQIISKYFLK